MIKPWLFEFFHAIHDPVAGDDPERVQQHYQTYLDLWVGDEARGFEGIFFSEHHFGPGYSPSPNLIIAHLAALTSTIRLGVLGTVTPYATPWRVAEEFAMLDHLTRGRLEIGAVSGIPPEQAVVGITPDQAAEIHAETLDVLEAAIAKQVVTHRGKHFSFDQVRITPTFLRPAPNVWAASTSEASAKRAGQRRLKMCGGFRNVDELVPLYDAYREGARASGNPAGPDQLAIRRQVIVVADPADTKAAGARARDGVAELMRFSFEAMRIPDAHIPTAPDELVYGTPDQVADEIIRQCQILGAGHFLASFNIFDADRLREAHDLFATGVIPRVREAEIEVPA